MIKNIDNHPIVREHNWNEEELIHFENKIVESWDAGKIRGPVHLSGGNEKPLIEIFKRISENDWVFSTWRSHYHALLKGVSPDWLETEILEGRSITIVNNEYEILRLVNKAN